MPRRQGDEKLYLWIVVNHYSYIKLLNQSGIHNGLKMIFSISLSKFKVFFFFWLIKSKFKVDTGKDVLTLTSYHIYLLLDTKTVNYDRKIYRYPFQLK